MHGLDGEDGSVQGFLKQLEVPYVFSDTAGHVCAFDKALAKRLVQAAGLDVPEGEVVSRGDASVWRSRVIVQPFDGGSTLGTTIADSQEELDAALGAVWERYLIGRWLRR